MTKRIYKPQISAERIASRRKELNMTQKELAEKSNIALSTLKQYEGAKRVPQEDVKKNLAQALGVYEGWLVGESNFKDIKSVLDYFKDELLKNDFIKDRLQVYTGFNAFIESLGYKLETANNDTWCLSSSNGIKYISNDAANSLINNIIDDTCKKLESIENNAPLAEKASAKEHNIIDDILQNDNTYQYYLNHKKEGDAND